MSKCMTFSCPTTQAGRHIDHVYVHSREHVEIDVKSEALAKTFKHHGIWSTIKFKNTHFE